MFKTIQIKLDDNAYTLTVKYFDKHSSHLFISFNGSVDPLDLNEHSSISLVIYDMVYQYSLPYDSENKYYILNNNSHYSIRYNNDEVLTLYC